MRLTVTTTTVSAVGKINGKFQENGTSWTLSAASYTGAEVDTRACPPKLQRRWDAYPYRGVTRMVEVALPKMSTIVAAWGLPSSIAILLLRLGC